MEDDDTYVKIGTCVELLDEDDVPKKPVPIHEQTVHDEQGRRRFHGAFTGGFSAGYFNSVGSKEGWTPSTFVSSRSKRTGQGSSRPEDFMDTEDLNHFGIAPRDIVTKDDFVGEKRKNKRSAPESSLLGAALADVVIPVRTSIGIKLLRKIGWKDGQGIGPRIARKSKPKPESGQKVYGCALPTAEVLEDDYTPEGVTFAPKDVNPIIFEAKDNLHGIGYSGIDPRSALAVQGHINLFEHSESMATPGKRGMTGSAFGVGALNDEDDDIYSVDNMANYDMVLGGPDKGGTHGWTAPKEKKTRWSNLPIGYTGEMLEGFSISDKPISSKKVHVGPQIPKNYRPFHKFSRESTALVRPLSSEPEVRHNAFSRGVSLGEKDNASVFNMISSKDKDKIESLKKKTELPAASAATPIASGSPLMSAPVTVLPSTSANTLPVSKEPLFKGSSSFKPFAKDPQKQQRYENFQKRLKLGHKDPYFDIGDESMTEWEKEREKDEFSRSEKLYKPMTSIMASRFTSAKYDDDTTEEVSLEEAADKSAQEKAAGYKMYGKMTHEVFEWHPHKTVCWRFNVPYPYPDSKIVGLPKVRREKVSIFNMLSIPPAEESIPEPEPPPSINISNVKFIPLPEAQDKKETDSQKESRSLVSFTLSKPQASSTGKKSDVTGDKITEFYDKTDKVPDERPPMDIFKAIFASSESSSSSSEDEDNENEAVKQDEEVKEDDASTKTAVASTAFEDKSKFNLFAPFLSNRCDTKRAPVAVASSSEEVEDEPIKDSPATPSPKRTIEEADSFGPALPPGSTATEDMDVSIIDVKSKSKKKKSHKEKKSKKDKKAKKKSSKHKKKKKKKQKSSSKRDESQSSSGDADSEDSKSDSDEAATEKKLIDRFKFFANSGKRMTAADFM